MNYWCESCARKNLCYVADDRPKCFVPITNTATDIGTSDTVYSDTAGYVPRVDMTDCSWKKGE